MDWLPSGGVRKHVRRERARAPSPNWWVAANGKAVAASAARLVPSSAALSLGSLLKT